MGPHCIWPRVWPHSKWPRRSLITIAKPGEPIILIKHWRGVSSSGPKTPAFDDSLSAEGSASESPSEYHQEAPVWH